MQKFTQKYTIIMLLEDRPVGYEFTSTDWPLHSTIADTFAVNYTDKLIVRLKQLASTHKPIQVTAAHDDFFGQQQETQVTILNMNDEILNLHQEIIELLENAGATFNSPQYNKEGFRAHATAQSHARLNEGDSVIFDNLTIVDMFPGKNPYMRKILQQVKLGSRVSKLASFCLN